MPRPSLKNQRTEEILDAFERCIGLYGFEASSLERIAQEASVQRPIIRHYIGNRDAVIAAFGARLMKRWRAETDHLFAALPGRGRMEALLEGLFGGHFVTEAEDLLLFESMIAAAPRYPKLRKQLHDWVEYFVECMANEVRAEYAGCNPDQAWTVAYAICALYFNLDSLAPLRLDDRYRTSSLAAARALLDSLQSPTRRKS